MAADAPAYTIPATPPLWKTTLHAAWPAFRLSWRRLSASRFRTATVLLSFAPIVLATLTTFALLKEGGRHRPLLPTNLPAIHLLLDTYLRTAYVGFVAFFMANILGFAAIRQDCDDRTLHYLHLQPCWRPVLLVAKYLAAVLMAAGLCILSLWISYLIMTLPVHGLRPVMVDLFYDGYARILLADSGVLCLALASYASIAVLMGCVFRSGVYAIFLLGWESALPYVPITLKQWSIMHYLQSILPERQFDQRRVFELLGEPASLTRSLVVLGATIAVFLAVASVVFLLQQCLYKDE